MGWSSTPPRGWLLPCSTEPQKTGTSCFFYAFPGPGLLLFNQHSPPCQSSPLENSQPISPTPALNVSPPSSAVLDHNIFGPTKSHTLGPAYQAAVPQRGGMAHSGPCLGPKSQVAIESNTGNSAAEEDMRNEARVFVHQPTLVVFLKGIPLSLEETYTLQHIKNLGDTEI